MQREGTVCGVSEEQVAEVGWSRVNEKQKTWEVDEDGPRSHNNLENIIRILFCMSWGAIGGF